MEVGAEGAELEAPVAQTSEYYKGKLPRGKSPRYITGMNRRKRNAGNSAQRERQQYQSRHDPGTRTGCWWHNGRRGTGGGERGRDGGGAEVNGAEDGRSEVGKSGRKEMNYSGDTQGRVKGRTEGGHNTSEDEMLLTAQLSSPWDKPQEWRRSRTRTTFPKAV